MEVRQLPDPLNMSFVQVAARAIRARGLVRRRGSVVDRRMSGARAADSR